MFPPPNVMVQPQDPSSWQVVSHNQFDGRKEDNFSGTSLLISFTGYDLPLDVGLRGDKFVQIYYLETVISAFDGGSWIVLSICCGAGAWRRRWCLGELLLPRTSHHD
jgi:hypothetical protein